VNSIITIRARWSGRPPAMGDYLMAPKRPRWAYEVVGVTLRDHLSAALRNAQVITIKAARRAVDAVPADATVHSWRWNGRGAKNKRMHGDERP
jgi:hypothetical protein